MTRRVVRKTSSAAHPCKCCVVKKASGVRVLVQTGSLALPCHSIPCWNVCARVPREVAHHQAGPERQSPTWLRSEIEEKRGTLVCWRAEPWTEEADDGMLQRTHPDGARLQTRPNRSQHAASRSLGYSKGERGKGRRVAQDTVLITEEGKGRKRRTRRRLPRQHLPSQMAHQPGDDLASSQTSGASSDKCSFPRLCRTWHSYQHSSPGGSSAMESDAAAIRTIFRVFGEAWTQPWDAFNAGPGPTPRIHPPLLCSRSIIGFARSGSTSTDCGPCGHAKVHSTTDRGYVKSYPWQANASCPTFRRFGTRNPRSLPRPYIILATVES